MAELEHTTATGPSGTRRTTRMLVLLGLCVMLGTLAAPALANQPAFRFTEDVTGAVIECDDATYTVTSGKLDNVVHEGESASGNRNLSLTFTPRKVVATDDAGDEYRIVGAEHVGATINSNTDGLQVTGTGTLPIVAQDGGIADSVNMTFHITAHDNNFVLKEFDFGTCAAPVEPSAE